MKLSKSYTLSEIKKKINEAFTFKGNTLDITFDNISTIFDANENSIVWVNPSRPDKNLLIENTKSKLLVCEENLELDEFIKKGKSFICVKDPKATFIRLLNEVIETSIEYKIHPTAVIHPKAKINAKVYIGPYSYIGESIIDEGVVINGHCYISDNCTIGKNVFISPGAMIGNEGFGYSRNSEGKLEKFPHFGGVIVERDAAIGANTCIDRGTLGNTVIGEGSKIDNLVHIAHNVRIGKHCMVIANSMIGGSTIIEDYSWIAPSATIRDAITIGERSTVGLGAVVTKKIPPNEVWIGNPAKRIDEFLENMKKIEKL